MRKHDALAIGGGSFGWAIGPFSPLLTGLLVSLADRRTSPAAVDQRQQRALTTQVENLKQALANLQRDAQVNDLATQSLHVTLT